MQSYRGALIAKEILRMINRETQLTAFAGVRYNKFLAKIASDINKSYGLTIIKPEEAEIFIEKLPTQNLPAVEAYYCRQIHE